ncbi:hypothetical protein [Kaistia algarum]|uniref:hypothetical protein n=1 Tax=Kaistia algarum TaxID=2083279 RepID=UPI000CE89CB8|nr:hypothetical protein [Kaistia algarum]MCX5512250.1 hypothetical protein [Kaistia algarum]
METTIHTAEDALASPDVVKSVELEIDYFTDEVVLRVALANSALADAFRDRILAAMKSGSVKIGPMVLRTPDPFEVEEV